MMQMFPSISGFDLASSAHFRPDHSRDSLILFKLNTLYP